MAGFVLKNTLSDNGGVTRGICKMDDSNNLTKVDEKKILLKQKMEQKQTVSLST